jgi:Lar family restriction alleviation protein
VTDELKPCPFCGGEAVLDNVYDSLWDVACPNEDCMGSIGLQPTRGMAIDAWNRRAGQPHA